MSSDFDFSHVRTRMDVSAIFRRQDMDETTRLAKFQEVLGQVRDAKDHLFEPVESKFPLGASYGLFYLLKALENGFLSIARLLVHKYHVSLYQVVTDHERYSSSTLFKHRTPATPVEAAMAYFGQNFRRDEKAAYEPLEFIMKDCKFKVNGTNSFRRLPLHQATSRMDYWPLIPYFIECGADPRELNHDGKSALHVICNQHSYALLSFRFVKVIHDERVNLMTTEAYDQVDRQGNTVLHIVAERGDANRFLSLMSKMTPARCAYRNYDEETAFDVAFKHKNLSLVAWMLTGEGKRENVNAILGNIKKHSATLGRPFEELKSELMNTIHDYTTDETKAQIDNILALIQNVKKRQQMMTLMLGLQRVNPGSSSSSSSSHHQKALPLRPKDDDHHHKKSSKPLSPAARSAALASKS